MFAEMLQCAVERFGQVDIFVNNAGILADSEWEKTVDINIVLKTQKYSKGGDLKIIWWETLHARISRAFAYFSVLFNGPGE